MGVERADGRRAAWWVALAAALAGIFFSVWVPRFHPTWLGWRWGEAVTAPVRTTSYLWVHWNMHAMGAVNLAFIVLATGVLFGLAGLWLGATIYRGGRPGFGPAAAAPALVLAALFVAMFVWPSVEDLRGTAYKLTSAAMAGDAAKVDALLKTGADINALDPQLGESALHLLIQTERLDMVRVLLDRGANVNLPDKYGFTPLDRAVNAFQADPKMVALLLERGAKPSSGNRYRSTPLCKVMVSGKVALAQVLVDHGADVNERGPDGRQPLCEAAYYDRKDMVIFLLQKGADVNAVGQNGETPIIVAANSIRRPESDELCRIFLDAGASPNAKTPNGDTALMRAAHAGNVAILQLLLSRGADPNASTKFGVTPLYEAVSVDNAEVVTALLEGGADMNQPSLGGKTPFQIAQEDERDDAFGAMEAAMKPGTSPRTKPVPKGSAGHGGTKDGPP